MTDPKNAAVTSVADVPAPPTKKRPAAQRASGSRAGDRFYRRIVGSMRNGVLAIDRTGRIEVINEMAYRILNLKPRASDVGRFNAEVLAIHRDVVRVLAGAFELGHPPNRAELRLKHSGKVIGYTLSHIQDDRGRTIGAAMFFKDLTRVEQIEERERLRDRLAALGEMAAAIAHEVKNPLAGIEVMAGVLKRQLADSPDAQGVLTDIIKEAKVANAIVLEVLDFVRPIRLQVEQVEVESIVRDALSAAEGQRTRDDIRVSLVLPADLPAIHADPHQLRQIFLNLITNAFEALGAGGTVEIGAYQFTTDDDQSATEPQPTRLIAIDVNDDGPGIPPDMADRIFSPFFTTKPRGTGLGLAIVRKIVDAHDGRIDVMARPGGGTRFRVTLPVTSAQQWYN